MERYTILLLLSSLFIVGINSECWALVSDAAREGDSYDQSGVPHQVYVILTFYIIINNFVFYGW